MRRFLSVVSLLVMGCGGAQSSGSEVVAKTPREACPESIPAPIPEPQAIAAWWNDKDAACPKGTMFKGTPPPFGDEVWCEKPDGTRNGPWTWWYNDDQMLSHGEYDGEGKPHGVWVAWHSNGNRKMHGEYVHGQKQGRWTMWHENGEPSTNIQFEAGVQNGEWVWWYESGNKAGQGEFLAEKPHGKWMRCSEDGYITKVEIYDNDNLVDWIDYDDGRRISKFE